MSYLNKRSIDGQGMQFAWDATSISMASKCMRYYYYKMIAGYAPKNTSVHLIFGGIYASALEQFYHHRAEGKSIDEALRECVRDALIESWDSDKQLPKSFDHVAKTRVNLIRTIVWYIEQFGDEDDAGITTHHLQNGKPAVELSFTLEATDDIVFCGHLDRVVSYSDSLWVMDQKTTGGTIGPYFFNQFSPDHQMSMYSWAGKQILQTPINGVIIDGAQIAVNFTRFERGFTTRTIDQLDEWFVSALTTINQAREFTRQWTMMDKPDEIAFPMNPASCGNYGGCEFRTVCSRPRSVRDNYLRGDFTQHVWDPLKAR